MNCQLIIGSDLGSVSTGANKAGFQWGGSHFGVSDRPAHGKCRVRISGLIHQGNCLSFDVYSSNGVEEALNIFSSAVRCDLNF